MCGVCARVFVFGGLYLYGSSSVIRVNHRVSVAGPASGGGGGAAMCVWGGRVCVCLGGGGDADVCGLGGGGGGVGEEVCEANV